MLPPVAQALEQLKAAYPSASIVTREDGEGGVYVIIDPVPIGHPYSQESTWVGFRIVHQYPYADTYPHYVRRDLTRVDATALAPELQMVDYEGRQALQISRRSNRLNPATETAAIKLQKVLTWLLTRP